MNVHRGAKRGGRGGSFSKNKGWELVDHSRNVIIDYHWLPHWKYTISTKLDLARPEVGWKITCDRPLF